MGEELSAAGFPRIWRSPLNPFIIQYVIVDWLYREVEPQAEQRLPQLQTLHGFRNKEVYDWIKVTGYERESRLCLEVYGTAELPQNVAWR
jgi:hypothetical protein